MATTEEIVSAARDLGRLIDSHEAARKLSDVLKNLEGDVDAQRLLNDHNRAAQTVAQKQSQGQPIEVEDKHKLEDLHKQVIRNPLLRDYQMAQMDFVDLMRKIDDAMSPQLSKKADAVNKEGS